ncbi:uricase [Stereum hirsutum FP-91666 SS1]|uniref:uricase n=1 Tax=Stereum hirsutum (strain FP-91666) TaxID=721885 RepID=UPI000440AC24|nr:uricase [Stereum hirsutum FP-91666 SS1]EIM90560.1 uricase [Stereum hirsutum FP-91666 SS1]
MSEAGFLSAARYGKDKVRVLRVVREPESKVHHIVEYNVTVLLEGDIETSYTQADNKVVVATDSMKNITYYLAKISPHILSPTRFALHLATHLVSKYPHIHKSFVTVDQLRWTRIVTSSKEGVADLEGGHTHAFWRDGDEKKFAKVEVAEKEGKAKLSAKVEGGLRDLLVLKSTGSAFEDFVRDEYTTLVEVKDRILSTSIDLTYAFVPFTITAPTDEKKLEFGEANCCVASKEGGAWDADKVAKISRDITLDVFAHDESASVQATLYKIAQTILAPASDPSKRVSDVRIALPNKHYIPVNMSYIGVDNMTPNVAEVFQPVDAPSGLITATISRT